MRAKAGPTAMGAIRRARIRCAAAVASWRERMQHLIARGVAVAVVDGLEIVQVEGQHGHPVRLVVARPAPQPGEPLLQAAAVEQPRERVVQRVRLQPVHLLVVQAQQPATVADGPQHKQHAGRARRGQQLLEQRIAASLDVRTLAQQLALRGFRAVQQHARDTLKHAGQDRHEVQPARWEEKQHALLARGAGN